MSYLDTLPQEIIGLIIDHIVDIDELNALKSLSVYVNQAVDKYIRKFSLNWFDYPDIKNALISFNSLNKIYKEFRIYFKGSEGAVIFKDKKFSVVLSHYVYISYSRSKMSWDLIMNHQLELVDYESIDQDYYKYNYYVRTCDGNHVDFMDAFTIGSTW